MKRISFASIVLNILIITFTILLLPVFIGLTLTATLVWPIYLVVRIFEHFIKPDNYSMADNIEEFIMTCYGLGLIFLTFPYSIFEDYD